MIVIHIFMLFSKDLSLSPSLFKQKKICPKKKDRFLNMPAARHYSQPKVAGGLFVASKYRASTNGSSAIFCTIVPKTSFGSIANLAVITSSETTGRKTNVAVSAVAAYGKSIVRCWKI